MSASERLRELEVTFREPDYDSGVRDNYAEALGDEMRKLLPLIADVVEAAEGVERPAFDFGKHAKLVDSLTALCDALEKN